MEYRLLYVIVVIFMLYNSCCICEDISSTETVVSESDSIKSDYVEQPLDHFCPLNTDYWKQRYFYNSKLYKDGGPIFIMLGGESSIDEQSLLIGSMMELCQKLNGIAFAVQHRFTGESFPINDTKLESLSYMNAPQVLSDFANFIQLIKFKFSLLKNKVVVVGGSYPGSLAVYMRMKYPHLVDIAWATGSGGNYAVNFPEYYETMGRVIKETSQKCYDVVQESFDSLEKLIWTEHNKTTQKINSYNDLNGEKEHRAQTCQVVEESFTLCESLNVKNEDDIRNFLQYLAQQFYHIVQYNGRDLNYTVDKICSTIFTNESDSLNPIQKLSKFINLINDALGFHCIDFTQKNFCEQLSRTGTSVKITAGAFNDSRQWWWLTCGILGNLQSSDSPNQPFGRSVPLSFLIKQCQCVFGERFTEDYISAQIQNERVEYGGLGVAKSVSRVIFVNGANDPWVSVGVLMQNQTTIENKVVLIKGASHCFDLAATKSTDASEVTEARREIHSQIENWLL